VWYGTTFFFLLLEMRSMQALLSFQRDIPFANARYQTKSIKISYGAIHVTKLKASKYELHRSHTRFLKRASDHSI
jgi:hypothetical protein